MSSVSDNNNNRHCSKGGGGGGRGLDGRDVTSGIQDRIIFFNKSFFFFYSFLRERRGGGGGLERERSGNHPRKTKLKNYM